MILEILVHLKNETCIEEEESQSEFHFRQVISADHRSNTARSDISLDKLLLFHLGLPGSTRVHLRPHGSTWVHTPATMADKDGKSETINH